MLRGREDSQVGCFDVSAFIERQGIGWPLTRITLLVSLILFVEGYDLFLVGNILPAVAKDFGVAPAALTPVMGAQFVAMALGGFVVAPLADRFGRRPLTLLCVAGFGLSTYINGLTHSVSELAATRFVTGLFMSAVMTNGVALLSEYAPSRMRATLITLSFIGFSLGTVCGSLISTRVAAAAGWPMALTLGAVLPLVAALVLWFNLPESLKYLVVRGGTAERISKALRRIDGALQLPSGARFVVSEDEHSHAGLTVRSLFREGRALSTSLLAIVFGLTLFNAGVSATWLPTVLVEKAGITLQASGDFAALMGTASIVSMLFLGRLIDLAGPARVLSIAYALGAAATVCLALVPWASAPRIACTIVVGMTTMAGQSGLNALAAQLYPAEIRATGTGWVSGFGRTLALSGPFVGSLLVRPELSFLQVSTLLALPLVLTAPLVFILGLQPSAAPIARLT